MTTNNKQAGERTQQWKVKLISGSVAYLEDGSHDVQITVQIDAVGYGNQLQVIRKLTAAPELLHELKEFVSRWGNYPKPPIGDDLKIYLDSARAAIAKAEGRM